MSLIILQYDSIFSNNVFMIQRWLYLLFILHMSVNHCWFTCLNLFNSLFSMQITRLFIYVLLFTPEKMHLYPISYHLPSFQSHLNFKSPYSLFTFIVDLSLFKLKFQIYIKTIFISILFYLFFGVWGLGFGVWGLG